MQDKHWTFFIFSTKVVVSATCWRTNKDSTLISSKVTLMLRELLSWDTHLEDLQLFRLSVKIHALRKGTYSHNCISAKAYIYTSIGEREVLLQQYYYSVLLRLNWREIGYAYLNSLGGACAHVKAIGSIPTQVWGEGYTIYNSILW